MTPTRLRGWTRKYGNVGWLMVAAYFAGCWFWTKRLYTLPTGLLALLLGIAWLHPHAQPHVPPLPLPVPQTAAAPKPAQDKLQETRFFHEGQDTWRVETWQPLDVEKEGAYMKFYCNGVLVHELHAEELDGVTLGFRETTLATRFPLLVVQGYPQNGTPTTARLYTLRHGQLIPMATLGALNGGPIFKDYDGDGKPEWVFDDYDWYEYYGAGPKYLRVYKELPNGELKLWKRLPNPHHRPLPANLGQEDWRI